MTRQPRPLLAAFVATLFGWFAGAAAGDLLRALGMPDSGFERISYVFAAALGLIIPFWGPPIFLAIWVVALLADGLLDRFDRIGRRAYAATGAAIGVAVGALVIGFFFKAPWIGVVAGAPVGAAAGLLFRWIDSGQPLLLALTHPDVRLSSPRSPGGRA